MRRQVMDRKKELKQAYKNYKPDMGVFVIKSNADKKCHVEESRDLKGDINSAMFKLDLGTHPNKALQKQWKERGRTAFAIDIPQKLEYDKDPSKTDYGEELAILKMLVKETLVKEGWSFF